MYFSLELGIFFYGEGFSLWMFSRDWFLYFYLNWEKIWNLKNILWYLKCFPLVIKNKKAQLIYSYIIWATETSDTSAYTGQNTNMVILPVLFIITQLNLSKLVLNTLHGTLLMVLFNCPLRVPCIQTDSTSEKTFQAVKICLYKTVRDRSVTVQKKNKLLTCTEYEKGKRKEKTLQGSSNKPNSIDKTSALWRKLCSLGC